MSNVLTSSDISYSGIMAAFMQTWTLSQYNQSSPVPHLNHYSVAVPSLISPSSSVSKSTNHMLLLNSCMTGTGLGDMNLFSSPCMLPTDSARSFGESLFEFWHIPNNTIKAIHFCIGGKTDMMRRWYWKSQVLGCSQMPFWMFYQRPCRWLTGWLWSQPKLLLALEIHHGNGWQTWHGRHFIGYRHRCGLMRLKQWEIWAGWVFYPSVSGEMGRGIAEQKALIVRTLV